MGKHRLYFHAKYPKGDKFAANWLEILSDYVGPQLLFTLIGKRVRYTT